MLNKPVSCDMMLLPSRPQRSRVRCQKFTKFVQKQVIRSKQELVNQKRGLLYARVVEDVYREGQKCANSNRK